MEVTVLNFTKSDNLHVSDTITSTGKDIAIFICLERRGNVRIELSLNGEDWAEHEILSFEKKQVNISGASEGQLIRLVSREPVIKSYYHA